MTDVATRTRSETSALTALALEELGGAVGGIGNIHRAVADRIFAGIRRGAGDSATPIKLVHDGVAGAIYGLVGGSAKVGGAAAGYLLDLAYSERVRPSEAPHGAVLLGILQGFRGDALEAERSPLATPMSIRVDGRPVVPDPAELAHAYPQARRRIVVFLHGLVETERSWRLGGRPTYGDRLASDLGVTPVDIRYNTGRHISENGETLSQLLGTLVANWPVEVEQIALVGHSMGGLVARSACHRADGAGEHWVRRVHQIVCLGSPHYGAPLEQFVQYAGAALNLLPESRPIGRLLRRRSAGIRDLRRGSLVDEDWQGCDPDGLFTAARREVPMLDGVVHCFVSAGIVASARNPLGALLGDGMVLVPSASGRSGSRRVGFRDEDGAHLPSANHFTLLNHDTVYGYLREWFSGPTILRK